MTDDANRAARRRQIINAVVRLTTRGGLQTATFRTIAEEAGVSVRLVQYYFGTKDQLLADTLASVGARVAARIAVELERLGPDPPPRAVVATIFEGFLPLDEPRRQAMLVFIAFRTASLTDGALASSDALGLAGSLLNTLEEQLRRAGSAGSTRPDRDARSEAILLAGALTGLSNMLLAGDVPIDEARRHLDYAIDRAFPDSPA